MTISTTTPPSAATLQRSQSLTKEQLLKEINELRKVRNAVILAHNYQIDEIQDVADFVGDSLGLSQQAAKTKAETIVFCGVHFMAETAAILCPQKRVLIPDLDAGCSLAASIDIDQLRAWKSEHPNAIVVSYVNTTAEIKAESDYCCTSGNALKIVQSIAADQEILFLPDQFLGSWVQKMTGRKKYAHMDGRVSCALSHSTARNRQQNQRKSRRRVTYPSRMWLLDSIFRPSCACWCRRSFEGRVYRRDDSARLQFVGEKICGSYRNRNTAPLEKRESRQTILTDQSRDELHVHEDDHP